jgi:hypothetical protein
MHGELHLVALGQVQGVPDLWGQVSWYLWRSWVRAWISSDGGSSLIPIASGRITSP